MALFGGCSGTKYNVDYCGEKESFTGAKDSYRAGQKVELVYKFVATDTDYSFFIDGERMKPDFKEGKGYIISFTMPEHDVSLSVDAKNSMVCIADTNKTAELTFHSFDGGGPSYKVNLENDEFVSFEQTRKYTVKNRELVCGAPYTVYVRFFGLKPGKTIATVEARSPIAENYDAVYDIEVGNDLAVSVTLREKVEIYR